MRYSGLPPIFDDNSKILILGSFPSVLSRKENFYYGNKLNRFWPMLAAAFDCDKPTTVEQKRALALSNGIALWDIVTSCEIDGSMDSNIKNYEVADLSVVGKGVRKILLNGSKAYEIFAKFYPELTHLAKKMPSTSSANPRYNEQEWTKELRDDKK